VNAKLDDPMIALSNKKNAKMKVWGYLKNNMTGWNRIVVKQTIMADELGITRQYIGKALKALEELNYIARDGKEQTNVVFMVNPEMVWAGKRDDLVAAISKYGVLINND